MAFRRLGLALCDDAGRLLPEGRHLRWFVPRTVGPPRLGFEVLHIAVETWKRLRTQVGIHIRGAGVATDGSVGSSAGSDVEHIFVPHPSVALHFRPSTELKAYKGSIVVASPGDGRNVLFRFREPVLYVRLILRGAAPDERQVEAFHRSARLASTPLGNEIELELPAITDVLVPLRIERISFVRESDIAALPADKAIQLLATILTPKSPAAAVLLHGDLDAGIRNRMLDATTAEAIAQRYSPAKVATLVSHLQSTIGEPARTITAPGGIGESPRRVVVLDQLNLAALDPNVARLLGWSWVDRQPRDGLYIARSKHGKVPSAWIHGFAFSHQVAPLPAVGGPIDAAQVPGIRFVNDKPVGRVGLSWSRPRPDLATPQRTVFVDVKRRAQTGIDHLTEKRPHLVSTQTKVAFTDESVLTGAEFVYEVTPIDIFGRAGLPKDTASVEVRDLFAPVPPRNLKAVVQQHGYPWSDPTARKEPEIHGGTVAATAEWGEAQRTASPDAEYIIWYWRAGTLPADDRTTAGWTALHKDPDSSAGGRHSGTAEECLHPSGGGRSGRCADPCGQQYRSHARCTPRHR